MITIQESSRFSLIVLSHIIVKKKQTRLSLMITKTKTPKIINLRRPFTHSKHNTIISWIHCSLAKAHSHYTKQKLTGKRRQTRHRCSRGRGHHHHPRGCPRDVSHLRLVTARLGRHRATAAARASISESIEFGRKRLRITIRIILHFIAAFKCLFTYGPRLLRNVCYGVS